MSYIVVYQREDGSSGLEECENLDSAVVAAERLRNVDSVENPRIFKTEEVKFDFRPYYRVEVSGEDDDSAWTPSPDPAPTSTSTTATTVAASTPAAPATSPPPPSAPSPASTSSIDPWAAADATPPAQEPTPAPPEPKPVSEVAAAPTESIDYSASAPEAEFDAAEAVSAPTPEGVEVAEAEAEDVLEADPSRGLFSTTSVPDLPKDASDIGKLAEDVNDVVPPRRGLFGR